MRDGLPTCSRHPGSHVTLGGHYGPPAARRQLYRCVPDAGTSHTFAGPLGRRMLAHPTTCDTCETHLHPHEGPASPQRHTYTIREVATALNAVAHGESYAQAAETVRELAGRRATRPGFGAQVVGAWVETLGPVVCAPYAESSWTETIVCDATAFSFRNHTTDRRQHAFSVLAIVGYEHTGGPRVLALHATHRANDAGWLEAFSRLGGTPRMVVSDQAQATANALVSRWPVNAPFLYYCEHHLRKNALARLDIYGLAQNDNPVFAALGSAFTSPQAWTTFRRQAGRHTRIRSWALSVDAIVKSQSAQRPLLPYVRSNSAVEDTLRKLRAAIAPRAWSLRNKERTNRMLELMRVRMNNQASEAAFAHTIREALMNGLILPGQMRIVDAGTGPVIRRRTPAGQSVPKPSLWV